MAYPPTPTLAIAACPPIQAYTGIFDPATDGPLVTPSYAQGATLSADALNQHAAQGDAVARAGGGAWGVIPGDDGTGCDLSAGAGLTLNIAEGAAMIDGYRHIAATSVVLTASIARAWIWVNSSGAVTIVNNSLTPPAGSYMLLGSAVTGGASITSVDFSGVLFSVGPAFHRYTLDSSTPLDTPPSNLSFFQHQEGDGSLWIWDGAVYWPISVGGTGVLPISAGGTGGTTAPDARTNLETAALGLLIIAPANGTNTLTDVQSNNTTIVLNNGGGASSAFTLAFTVAGTLPVRPGHSWSIINNTFYGCLIRRSGSGVGYVGLGPGCRGEFSYDSNADVILEVARAGPRYASAATTGTFTPSRFEIESDLFTLSAQTAARVADLPATVGYEGRLTVWQADQSTYPLTVETVAEAEPDAITVLLPGECQALVVDGAGANRRAVSRPYMREVVIDFALDANRTLSTSEALAFTIVMQDTGPVLTAGRNVIWDTATVAAHKVWAVVNETLQTLTFKTTAGGGVAVAAGKTALIRCNSVDMKRLTPDA